MLKFKLTQGMHQQKDMLAEPDKDGRRPSRTYCVGETIHSEIDLGARYGRDKFVLLGEARLQEDDRTFIQSSFPGGQVSSGFQETAAGVPGPVDEERAKKLRAQERRIMEEERERSEEVRANEKRVAEASDRRLQEVRERRETKREQPQQQTKELRDFTHEELRAYAEAEELEVDFEAPHADLLRQIAEAKGYGADYR